MDKYRQQLKSQDRWKAGDSIIRDINVYDPHNFTIEQDISILIYRRPESWIGKLLPTVLHNVPTANIESSLGLAGPGRESE
jgi:hypothetical protein